MKKQYSLTQYKTSTKTNQNLNQRKIEGLSQCCKSKSADVNLPETEFYAKPSQNRHKLFMKTAY